jgi:hypothetical protein
VQAILDAQAARQRWHWRLSTVMREAIVIHPEIADFLPGQPIVPFITPADTPDSPHYIRVATEDGVHGVELINKAREDIADYNAAEGKNVRCYIGADAALFVGVAQ